VRRRPGYRRAHVAEQDRGHGGGIRQRAGLGAAHEGERAGGTHCRGLNFKNCGAGTVKQGNREDYPEEEEE
jgi:hypothetical protein